MKITTTSSRNIGCCQLCGSDALTDVLFLGYVPPVNSMPAIDEQISESIVFPLNLLRCDDCTLVQIGCDVDPEILFPYSYPYLSGSTRILRDNFAELEKEASKVLTTPHQGLIIDIGSNDGTLLSNFDKVGYKTLGVEPSQAGEVARANGIDTITDYFSAESAKRIALEHGNAVLVTAANVFAHIRDVDQVIDGIKELLSESGVFISENHYLPSLLETLQYDTVYHEHLRYYSIYSLQRLFEKHDLEIFKVQKIPTHGGSVRVFTARKGVKEVDQSVARFLEEEVRAGVTDGTVFPQFANAVLQSKLDLMSMLAQIKASGKRVFGIGAPSRASTLINYVGLDRDIMDAVMEVSSSHKLNKFIPGTRIPVLDESMLYDQQPEYALLLSWHINEELIATLRKNGFQGRFICPLPSPFFID